MKLRNFTRLFLKIFFWWLSILLVLFYNVIYVNLKQIPHTDHILEFSNIIKKTEHKKPIHFDKVVLTNKDIKELETFDIELEKAKEKAREKQEREYKIKKQKYLLSLINYSLKHRHLVASNEKVSYEKLCEYYPSYCKIIDIPDDEFSKKDKVYYTAITIYLLRFLSSYFPTLENNLYYIKIQQERVWRRWYAGHHSIVLNIKKNTDYKQFLEVLTHEMWHVIDLWILNWKSYIKSETYTEFGKKSFSIDDPSIKFYALSWNSEKIKNPYTYAKDFVSGYALTDPFEDFAESFNMYINHNALFLKMAKESNILKKKYAFINKYMKWNYLLSDKNYPYRNWFRPRDTTRIK